VKPRREWACAGTLSLSLIFFLMVNTYSISPDKNLSELGDHRIKYDG
jgi:hypothetical protein